MTIVNRWLEQLSPNGLLLMEELEAVSTAVPVFQQYLRIMELMLQANGSELLIGGTLAKGEYCAEVTRSEKVTFPVRNRQAAAWFYANAITSWQDNAFVRATWLPEEHGRIIRELDRIRQSGDGGSNITWTMRRMVFGR